MNTYYVEYTDTFAGEANYSFCNRFVVTAKSELGAIRKVGNYIGVYFRKVGDYGDMLRYDSKSGLTCAFVSLYDDDQAHGNIVEL